MMVLPGGKPGQAGQVFERQAAFDSLERFLNVSALRQNRRKPMGRVSSVGYLEIVLGLIAAN